MTYSNLRYFVGGMILSAALMLSSTVWTKNTPQSFAEFERLVDAAPVLLNPALAEETRALMKRTMLAHHQQDTAALIADLHEDYTFYSVSEDGPMALAESREIAAEMTANLYQSDYMKNYIGVKSQPIAIVGNIGIQLDVEGFAFDDGTTEMHTLLTVLELKDGKILRNWAFNPETGEDK
ncbi:MAG: hypothetical protein RIB43_08865 [Rhodospirillaceae bacterium]